MQNLHVEFDIPAALTVKHALLWDVMSCSPLEEGNCFGMLKIRQPSEQCIRNLVMP